jgi:hypothetical protein
MPAPPAPRSEFVYEAIVEVAAQEDLGNGPYGQRRIVPIIGGTFEGPSLRGTVTPGGADRQLLRADGLLELDALYELRTDDGAVLTVRNQVMIDMAGETPYVMSHIRIDAPEGRYAWLSRRVLVGTLQPLMPERNAVRVGVYQLL